MSDDATRQVGSMELPEATVEDVLKRLRRVEGQVRGIQQMIDDGRDCRDVVTQIAAANKALEQVGFVLVSAGLTWCVRNPDASAEAGYDVGDVQKMFLKLA
jgi:DNA-binding FrmR family transcriptional regulator